MLKVIDKMKLAKLKRGKARDYSDYLEMQFERSYGKSNGKNPKEMERKNEIINVLSKNVDFQMIQNALVIGCRNSDELDILESKGIRNVSGIDLFSRDRRVFVMDMHNIDLSDDSFDLLYCSHSLEHALDYKKVIGEIIRIAKDGSFILVEVPINFEPRGSDIHDYGSSERVIGLFQEVVKSVDVLYKRDIPKEENSSGTDVARVIIRIANKK